MTSCKSPSSPADNIKSQYVGILQTDRIDHSPKFSVLPATGQDYITHLQDGLFPSTVNSGNFNRSLYSYAF
jgi:hypothetical protein